MRSQDNPTADAAETRWCSEVTVPPDDTGGIDGIKSEDSGEAIVMYSAFDAVETGGDGHFFVRLHSWDERSIAAHEKHVFFRRLMGRRIRITVETVDGQS